MKTRSIQTIDTRLRLYSIEQVKHVSWKIYYFKNYLGEPKKFVAFKNSDYVNAVHAHNRIETIEGTLEHILQEIRK